MLKSPKRAPHPSPSACIVTISHVSASGPRPSFKMGKMWAAGEGHSRRIVSLNWLLIKQAAQFDSGGAESTASDGRRGLMCYTDYSHGAFVPPSPCSSEPPGARDAVIATGMMAKLHVWNGDEKSWYEGICDGIQNWWVLPGINIPANFPRYGFRWWLRKAS